MKKISKKLKVFIAILFLISSVCLYSLFKDCGILARSINCNIVLENCLYQFGRNGLIQKGYIYDDDWGFNYFSLFLNSHKKKIYFDGCLDCGLWINKEKHNIYSLDISNQILNPSFVLKTGSWAHISSISPDGNYMIFMVQGAFDNELKLLNLNTIKYQNLVDNFYGISVWLNNHQFVYCSSNLNSDKKRPLYLYDIKTDTKTDMKLDDFYPGAVTPDGKELMLAGNGKTILYDIENRSIKIFANKEMRITNMIWLPDGKGFLYSDRKFSDLFDAMELYYGLYYYSLEKKRSIRLMKLYDLSTKRGFIVPSSINIKLPDTSRNRDIATGKRKNIHLVKICSW